MAGIFRVWALTVAVVLVTWLLLLASSALTLSLSLPLAVATTLLLGFVLVPAAAHLFRAHEGHSLYNMGCVAGLLGMLTVAVYESCGFVPEPVFICMQGGNRVLGTLLGLMFAATAATGLALYNNGFAAGLVAAVLLPVILALRASTGNDDR